MALRAKRGIEVRAARNPTKNHEHVPTVAGQRGGRLAGREMAGSLRRKVRHERTMHFLVQVTMFKEFQGSRHPCSQVAKYPGAQVSRHPGIQHAPDVRLLWSASERERAREGGGNRVRAQGRKRERERERERDSKEEEKRI